MIPPVNLRRLLLAAAIPFTLTACNGQAASDANGSAAAADTNASQATEQVTPTRTGYATVEGGRIYYQIYGDLASGKTPLLVLHGSFMSGDAMQPFVAAFAASRPVITVDARGHGRTGQLPGPVTYEIMADDAAAVLASLNVRSADVFGYSMGGTTALFLAVRHPDRVGKQVILAGTSRRDGWYPEVLQGMAHITPEMFANTPIAAEYRRLSPTPNAFPTFVRQIAGLEEVDYRIPDVAVRAIDDKTMIIVGDADGVELNHAIELFRLRGGGDAATAARGFLTGPPRARLAILPATSHAGLLSEATRIAELANPFLDDRGPPRLIGFFQGMDTQPAQPPGDGHH